MSRLPFQLRRYQREMFRRAQAHPVSIAVMSRRVGKSATLALLANTVSWQGHDVITVSASLATCKELMRKTGGIAHAIHPATDVKALGVDLPIGSKIFGLAANPRTLRGYGGWLFLDEADFYAEPEDVWRAATGIAAEHGYHIVVASTPLCQGSWLHGLVTSGEFPVQVVDIYEAIKDGAPLDVELIRKMIGNDEVFAAEFECDWASGDGLFFDTRAVAAAQMFSADHVGQPIMAPLGDRRVLGIDIGKIRDATVITLVSSAEQGQYVCHQPQEVMLRVPYPEQIEVIKHWVDLYNPEAIAIDARGSGAPIADFIREYAPGRTRDVTTTNPAVNAEMMARVRRLIGTGALKLEPSRDLVRDFSAVKRATAGVSTLRDKTGHGDRVWSLAYAIDAIDVSPVHKSRIIRNTGGRRWPTRAM